jgi:hypothetical protein
LLFEQAVEPLEALCVGDGLRVTPGGVLRSIADLIERVLIRSGFTIDLGLRRERFLKLSAGRCAEQRRGNERHHEVEPPSASSFGYSGF